MQYLFLETLPGKNVFKISPPNTGDIEPPSIMISARAAGDMSIAHKAGHEKRHRVFRSLDIDPDKVAYTTQKHSKELLHVDSEKFCQGTAGDGLVTIDDSIVLSVTAADCLPIYLFSRKERIFSILHSGWRGTGIASMAINHLKDKYSVLPEDITAVIGPGIGPCCYNVDQERASLFSREFGKDTVIQREGGPWLDLKKANNNVLKREGVGSVFTVPSCTHCDSRLGSYRREGPEKYTLMVAFIGYFK